MASRLLWRPFVGGALWSGTGLAAGSTLPTVLANASIIQSTGVITTSFWCGAFLILLPLGIARGTIQGVQEICHLQGRVALQHTLDQTNAATTQFLTTKQGNQQLLEKLTLGSSWQGRLVRILASPFLPSTSQMMVRLQELAEKNDNHLLSKATSVGTKAVNSSALDSQVIVTAVDGFIEGFLQDKKDSLTMICLVAYAGILGIGFGGEYSYRRFSNKEEVITEKDPKVLSSQKLLDFRSIPERLGLLSPDAEKDQEPKEIGQKQKNAPGVVNDESSSQSFNDTLNAAQVHAFEILEHFRKGKEEADPYLKKAAIVVEQIKDEVRDQFGRLFEQAKIALLDEENQQHFKEQWKQMTQTMRDLSPDDETLHQASKEMEEILRKAKERLNDDDVKQMQKDLQNSINEAQVRLNQAKKDAQVEERLQEARAGVRQKVMEWWWNSR